MTPSGPCPAPDQLDAYARGRLAGGERDGVRAHLAVCRACAEQYGRLRAGRDETEGLADGPPAEAGTVTYLRPGPADDSPVLGGTPLPPQLGKYRLLRELGRGGMGAVYEAVHTNLNKRVAVKVILPEYSENPRTVARFRREARAIGELSHPNVVAATDADEAGGWHFLVMELIDGLDLRAVVRRAGPLPVADACEAVRQAAVGLQYIGERGLVHRDVKPSNLMLSADGVVKILDLGLAALRTEDAPAGGLTGHHQVMGTADYMAPEQWADSRGADIRADIYSLGCSLHHLLAGRAPFDDPEHSLSGRKQVAHAETPPPPLRDSRADVPAGVEAVMRQMLAKRPEDRYQTPGEVAEALGPFAAGADLPALVAGVRDRPEAPTPALSGSVRKRPRAKPWRAWALGLAILAAGATAAFLIAGRGDGPAEGLSKSVAVAPPPAEDPGPRPGEWYPLLRREPTPLFWQDPRHTHFLDFSKAREELRVDAPYVGLLALGRAEYPGYRIQVGIRQTRWVGGVGLFIGHHEVEVNGAKCHKCQLFELTQVPGAGQGTFVLERKTLILGTANGEPMVVGGTGMASATVPRPPDREEVILQVEVTPYGLGEVVWDGRRLNELTRDGLDAQFRPADYVGPFGTFNRKSPGVFGNAQIKLHERSPK